MNIIKVCSSTIAANGLVYGFSEIDEMANFDRFFDALNVSNYNCSSL